MPDEDKIEAVLLAAAGERRPTSSDISPILALIEEGLDLDGDIIPGIHKAKQHASASISSWRWYATAIKAALKERPKRPVIDAVGRTPANEAQIEVWRKAFGNDFADGPRPVIWIRGSDPRFSSMAPRWAAEKPGQKPPAPITSNYFSGYGWAFPAHWIGL